MLRTTAAIALISILGASFTASSSQPSAASPSHLIAFSAGTPGGVQDIYVVRDDGRGLRRLTHGAAKEFTPTWSPDGRRIAYRFQSGSDQSAEIYVMRADGSHARNLTK